MHTQKENIMLLVSPAMASLRKEIVHTARGPCIALPGHHGRVSEIDLGSCQIHAHWSQQKRLLVPVLRQRPPEIVETVTTNEGDMR